MGISNLFRFDWWQILLIIIIIVISPLIRAVAAVIVGNCVKPEIAKIALPLIFPYRNRKIRNIERHPDSD